MIMTEAEQEQWMPLTEAAKEIGISAAKLSRMVRDGKVASQKDPYDERRTLVNFIELRKIFPPRK
jgi:hypothetical protein